MVRSTHKINKIFSIVAVFATTAALINPVFKASATDPTVTLEVDIAEVLTVSLTNPTTWATGDINQLLRNKVTVSALTNNYYGATVSMYANDTKLKNTATYSSADASSYIDTLTSGTTTTNGAFSDDVWAYSVQDNDAGIASAIYNPVPLEANLVKIIENSPGHAGTVNSEDVFFGAKATSAKQSGTYAQTVNFVAVTGVIDTETNPQNPTTPSTDNSDAEIASNTPHYNPSTGRTTYTTRSTNTTNNTTTTTTNVMNGNTVSAYANAAGVTRNTNNGQNVATALAVAAGVAAVSGVTFYALAKRSRDDEDDEDA